MILITNDDGYRSPGIISLFEAVYGMNENVGIVAPIDQKSASGMATTQGKSMEMVKGYIFGKEIYGISGNPADAVILSLNYLYSGKEVEMILSGINAGSNLGLEARYTSGTLSAAIIGAMHGIKGIAFSMSVEDPANPSEHMFSDAIPYCSFIVSQLMENGFPEGVDVLNVNFPRVMTKDTLIKIVPFSKKALYNRMLERIKNSPKSVEFQSILSFNTDSIDDGDSDIPTVYRDGNISVTPMNVLEEEMDLEGIRNLLCDQAIKEEAQYKKF